MAVFKCKICGGNLEVKEGMSVCECEYCGTKQTLPKMNDERRANLYDRANHFRRNNEFDKAMTMYEQILQEDREDAEAYWSLVLCTYGIEYVEDPASHTRKPTVNRTQYTSVFADENYKAALRYADENQRALYEEEAKQIDGIQKGILDISNQEEPFDVFICYKETDAAGQRTQDSVLANDLYHQLTQEGFKVFFARITLEDKLGSAYEPYIFAALNSSKVMVVLGTRPEYFNAVWVRNEWSRYLSLIKNGAKKVLIPAYKDMDPYDLPQEFSHLQSQDMGKLGFMQDLIRGIRKLTGADQKAQATVSSGNAGNETAALLKRAFLFLEDGDFAKADEYCERVLNLDPENAEAYLGKLMAQLNVRKRENLAQNPERLDQTDAFRKIMRFGGETIKSEAEGYNQQILKRLKEEEERQQKLRQEQEEKQRQETYQGALKAMESAVNSGQLKEVIGRLKTLGEYKDAAAKIAAAAEKLAQFEKKERKKSQRMAATAVAIAVIVVAAASAVAKRNQYNQAMQEYNQAMQAAESLLQDGDYDGAYRQFAELLGKKQAGKEIIKAMHSAAIGCLETEEYEKALYLLKMMDQYTDDTAAEATRLGNAMYQAAQKYVSEEAYDKAAALLSAIGELPDTADTAEAAAQLADTIYRTTWQYLKQNQNEKAAASYALMEREEMAAYRIPIEDTKVELAGASIGDYVHFGVDFVDNPLAWLVLEKKENGEVLLCTPALISAVSLDATRVPWKDSIIRKYLNNDVYNTCFTSDEQALILNSVLQNERFPINEEHYLQDEDLFHGSQKTEETEDKVFLLSLSEMIQYIYDKREKKNSGQGARWKLNDWIFDGLNRSSGFYVNNVVTGETFETLLFHDMLMNKEGSEWDQWAAFDVANDVIKVQYHGIKTIDGGGDPTISSFSPMAIWVNPYTD